MRLTQFLGKRNRHRGIHFAQLCADDALTGALTDYFERVLASLAPQKAPPHKATTALPTWDIQLSSPPPRFTAFLAHLRAARG